MHATGKDGVAIFDRKKMIVNSILHISQMTLALGIS